MRARVFTVVCQMAVYGGVSEYLSTVAARLNITVTFVDATHTDNFTRAIQANTKVIYAETECNPTLRLTDIRALGEVAAKHNIPLVVDGTFSTPYHTQCLQYPGNACIIVITIDLHHIFIIINVVLLTTIHRLCVHKCCDMNIINTLCSRRHHARTYRLLCRCTGVSVIINAATKYLGGHSDLLAGCVSSNDAAFLNRLGQTLKLYGANLSAFDAFLLARGIKTFDVRMQRHAENAMKVADFLQEHKAVQNVYYPGMHHAHASSHPSQSLTLRAY